MPTFEVTSPDGRKFRVTAPEGATQEQAIAYVQQQGAQTAPEAPQRSFGEEALRQGGLMARNAAEGVMALPGAMLDPVNRMLGLKPVTEATSSLATRAGLPTRDTGAERISGEAQKAMWSGAGPFALAQRAGAAAAATPLVKGMMSAPAAEFVAPMIGGAAGQVAAEAGAPEWAQLAASVGAPMAANAVTGMAKGAGRAAAEVTKPITRKGAEQIAADIIGRTTQDRTTALRNLKDYVKAQKRGQVGVPGSLPTAAAVAGDYGITGAQQVISRGDANPQFATRFAENNAARLDDLAKLNATDRMLEQYARKRDAITAPMREQVFAQARGPVDVDGVLYEVVRTSRTSKAQGADSQKALRWIAEQIEGAKERGAVSPEDLYNGLHKDLNQLVGKGVDSASGRVRLSAGVANEVKRKLADAIEEQAPGFKRYLEKYARLSRPIDRLEVMRDRLGGEDLTKVTNALPMVTPEGAQYQLSQAKMRNAVTGIRENTPYPLAPRQDDVLSRVMGDLNANEAALRGGRQPGSDTYQNMAAANFVNRILGQGVAETGVGRGAAKTLGVAYKPFGAEQRINDILIEAYLDPKKMRELLKKARTTRAGPSLAGAVESNVPWVTGGLLGAL